MFVGTFEHTLDEKGRVVLPAVFRTQLAERGFVSQYQGCLGLWTEEGFVDVVERLKERVRSGQVSQDAMRALGADATEVKPDSQGRILLPQRLREYAGLGGDVVVIGALERIEIWDAETWRQLRNQADSSLRQAIDHQGV